MDIHFMLEVNLNGTKHLLFRKTTNFYSENYTHTHKCVHFILRIIHTPINAFFYQNPELLSVKTGGTYRSSNEVVT
jgi:hypothetical protein